MEEREGIIEDDVYSGESRMPISDNEYFRHIEKEEDRLDIERGNQKDLRINFSNVSQEEKGNQRNTTMFMLPKIDIVVDIDDNITLEYTENKINQSNTTNKIDQILMPIFV